MTIKTVPIYGYKGGLYRELLEGEDPRGSVKAPALLPSSRERTLVHLPRGGLFHLPWSGSPVEVRRYLNGKNGGPGEQSLLHRAWGEATYNLDLSTVRWLLPRAGSWSFVGMPDARRIWKEAQPASVVRVTGPTSYHFVGKEGADCFTAVLSGHTDAEAVAWLKKHTAKHHVEVVR